MKTGVASVNFDKMGLRNDQEKNLNNQDCVVGDSKVNLVCESSHQHFMAHCSIVTTLNQNHETFSLN